MSKYQVHHKFYALWVKHTPEQIQTETASESVLLYLQTTTVSNHLSWQETSKYTGRCEI